MAAVIDEAWAHRVQGVNAGPSPSKHGVQLLRRFTVPTACRDLEGEAALGSTWVPWRTVSHVKSVACCLAMRE
eukprot:4019272-Prymnesium_polylepis.2